MAIFVASAYFLPVTWNRASLTASLARYSSGVSLLPIVFPVVLTLLGAPGGIPGGGKELLK